MSVEVVGGEEVTHFSLPVLRHVMSLSWRANAECATLPKDIFFDYKVGLKKDKAYRLNLAMSTCSMCPVRTDCYEFAVLNNEPHGIWAGTLPEQRRKLYNDYIKTGNLEPLPTA